MTFKQIKKLVSIDYLSALPGFFRLDAWLDGDEIAVDKKAIVGWRVRTYAPANELDASHTQCDPIIMLGEVSDMDSNAILRPDGMVETYDIAAQTFDDWMEYERGNLVKERDRKAAKAKANATA